MFMVALVTLNCYSVSAAFPEEQVGADSGGFLPTQPMNVDSYLLPAPLFSCTCVFLRKGLPGGTYLSRGGNVLSRVNVLTEPWREECFTGPGQA